MSNELIAEQTLSGATGASFDLADRAVRGAVKVIVSGEIEARNGKHALLIRLNGLSSGYRSFSWSSGDYSEGQWSSNGFGLGFNGWNQDAAFMAETTLSTAEGSQKVLVAGLSTFAHSTDKILGFQNNGYLTVQGGLRRLDVLVTGGVATGSVRIFNL